MAISGIPLPASKALFRALYSSLPLPALVNLMTMLGFFFMKTLALALRLLSQAQTLTTVLPLPSGVSDWVVPHAANGTTIAAAPQRAIIFPNENLIVSLSFYWTAVAWSLLLAPLLVVCILKPKDYDWQIISMISTISIIKALTITDTRGCITQRPTQLMIHCLKNEKVTLANIVLSQGMCRV